MRRITNLIDCTLVKILLFGDQNYTQLENSNITNATIKYSVDSERFNVHFCSCMWLKWFECIYDYLLFIDVFNTSAYDKHLGASFCISQVLSMYFSFCFNSCIVKHNLKMISYSLCRILSFQNHIFKFPVFKGYIWYCLCWSMKIKNPENFNENWWTKHKTSYKLHFFL